MGTPSPLLTPSPVLEVFLHRVGQNDSTWAETGVCVTQEMLGSSGGSCCY